MRSASWPPLGLKRLLGPLILMLCTLGASTLHAQAIPDPCQSEVQALCNNIIFIPPSGYGDPLGDLGLLVTLRDDAGLPMPGIPPSAFAIRTADGAATFQLTGQTNLGTEPTDEEGRIVLTRSLQGFGNAIDTPLIVSVTLNSTTYDLDCTPTPTVNFVSPDMNGDATVNITDVGAFATCYLGGYCVEADFNGNGEMDFGDVVIFQRYMGFSKQAGVPEPEPTQPWPGAVSKNGEALFIGCLQMDFDDDGDASTITDSLIVLPNVPLTLNIIARDFTRLAGVNLSLTLPPGLTLFPGGCITAEAPFTLGPGATSDCGSAQLSSAPLSIGSQPCLDDGPIFVARITFWGTTARLVRTSEFVLAGELSDCQPRPNLAEACIGSPTPCEVSSLDIGQPNFLTCPGADMDLQDTLVLTLRDQDGEGIAGVSEAEIEMSVFDERGSYEGERFRISPLDLETDANGEIRYRFEPREACRWDGCFDLLITAHLEACELEARKSVRTLNLVRFQDDPSALDFDEINDSDVTELANKVGTLDSCADLLGLYRCTLVLPEYLTMVQDHMGHACSVTSAPDLPPVRWTALKQNVPNPFNPRTRITVNLAHEIETARLEIYTVDGRFIQRLWDGPLSVGETHFQWNGSDEQDRAVSSGVYVARLQADQHQSTIRMVLLR